jgi:probable rRNA maturation factor
MTVTVVNHCRRHRADTKSLQKLAGRAAKLAKLPHQSLEISLVSDKKIAELNEKFHQTRGPTDILTFDYAENNAAELIISLDHAHQNAARFGNSARKEIQLYVVHGILHLAGFDDATPSQQKKMRAAESRLLLRLKS